MLRKLIFVRYYYQQHNFSDVIYPGNPCGGGYIYNRIPMHSLLLNWTLAKKLECFFLRNAFEHKTSFTFYVMYLIYFNIRF